MWILKKYKKKLEKQFKREQFTRCQLNFTCDVGLIAHLKLLAMYLETPFYPLAEHVLELGISEIGISIQDKALTELLQRHLLKEHLLVGQLNPVDRSISERAKRIDNALKFLKFIEQKAGSVEAVEHIIERFAREA
ncbi:hypothetical protein ACFLV0_07520 [Chloroflexota bacterium]